MSMSISKSDCISKIVVFDLDETLGYFVEFGIFWDSLKQYLDYKNKDKSHHLNQNHFNEIFDLYPEFQRPDILKILQYLKHKKESNECNRIMIYTNNQGPKTWADYIKKYYELKLKYPLFDQIIAAFKVNGQTIEICRTTHYKTHKDLIKCSKIPHNTQICFVDDTFFPEMSNDNVYYINIKPYIHSLSFEIMIDRFCNSSDRLLNYEIDDCKVFKGFMLNMMNKYLYQENNKIEDELEVDKILSKKILEHLKYFFNKPINKVYTRKNKEKEKERYKNKNKEKHKKTRKIK